MTIPARISIVTLGVADLKRSEAFYGGLGWEHGRWPSIRFFPIGQDGRITIP
jgi:catechol 2,3-dioxygenase-like lactoylglutathione lyase family enzyme